MKQKQSATDIRAKFPHFIAEDPATIAVLEQAAELATSELDVLLVGESGVGKELLAQGIHHLSRRTNGPFVPINVAAMPETMIESELFGHEKGAFTGASERHLGRFEQANGGTLFLDEIGHLPVPQQAKLLRVLQEKAVHRLGGATPIRLDVRVMAATDQDLVKMVKAGTFHRSLYFRFQARIEIPPLRERLADTPALVRHFLPVYNRKHEKNLISVSAEALAYLRQQPWPGNVRQLLSALEVAVVQAEPIQRTLEVDDFKPLLRAWEDMPAGQVSDSEFTGLDRLTLDQIHEMVIRRRLEIYKGNKTKAAKSLGIDRETLRRYVKKYEIEVEA